MKRASKKVLLVIAVICFSWAMISQSTVFAAAETTWYVTQSGACGNNNTPTVKWQMMATNNPTPINNRYDYERLVISGTGEMKDYYLYGNGSTNSPWYEIIWDTNSIVVEEGVTRIGNSAFIGSTGICYLSLPESLQSIGSYAFSSALKYVKKVTVPSNVTDIREYAFCSNEFTEVEILGNVTTLEEGVFSSCNSLKSITIPKSVTSIENYAFDCCTSLKDVYYDGTRAEWEEISIGYGNSYLLNATIHFPIVKAESVSLDKTSKTMFVGSSFTLTATVLPENAENKTVSWKSSNTSVATVENGVVTAVSPGTARITVTTADGEKTDYCTISVQASTVSVTGISLNKTNTPLTIGDRETLVATVTPANATNKSVTWSSSNANVAAVSNGTVTAVSEGTAVITATTVDGGKTVACTVTVKAPTVAVTGISLNKASAALTVGDTETLVATVTPGNATNKGVIWTSSNTSVATVSNGTVTAVSEGTAVITATTVDGGKTVACTVTVKAPTVAVTEISLNKASAALTVGDTETLVATVTPDNATNKGVIWTSSNTSVATVSNGTVTAVSEGTAVITATTVDGSKTDACTITVISQIDKSLSVNVSSKTACIGKNVSVPVTVSNNCGINTIKVKLTYDRNALELISVERGEVFSEIEEVRITAENPIIIVSNALTDTNANGIAFTLNFKVKDSAQVGDYSVTLTYEVGDVINIEGKDVALIITNGNLTVIDVVPGDANGDGAVNMKDSLLLRKHLAGWDVELDLTALDVNSDGAVNMKDSLILRKFLAGWDVELG